MKAAYRMLFGASLVVAAHPATSAHSQPQSPPSNSGGGAQLKVGHVDYARSLEALLEAAKELRESIQHMAQQEPGAMRAAAIDAAYEALVQTQRAMLKLPPDWRIEDVKVRDAKEWPKAMARLDAAARSLQNSIAAISKQPDGKERSEAIGSVRRALAETQQAMLAVPDAGATSR